MLQHNIERGRQPVRALPGAQGPAKTQMDAEREALGAILQSLRRNVRLIALTTLIGTAGVSAIVVLGMTPQSRATATLLVDSRKTQILKDQEVIGRPGTENSAIESEAEMIKSPAILRKVAEQLHLDQDAEFMGSPSLVGWLKTMLIAPFSAVFNPSEEAVPVDRLALAAEALSGKINAARRNLTYVIELSVWSESAPKAALLANSIADAYLADQIGAKNAATRQATGWLNDEVERLRTKLLAAENTYESFKAEAGLFNPDGQNLADRQISQLNEQLVMARARAAEAQSKFEQLREINADKLRSGAASPDVLQSAVLTNMRNQYADVARKQAELTSRYGARHPQVISVNAELINLSSQIRDELDRIVASARTEYEMAKSNHASLNASLEELKLSAATFNQKAVKLHEYEREAQANRALFEAFLARAKETAAQLHMQLPDSRILSAATVPLSPSYPRKSLMIGLGFFGSLAAGLFLALARGMLSEGFRRASDLQSAFGLRPLATIPLVEPLNARHAGAAQPVALRAGAARLARLVPNDPGAEERRLADLVIREPDSPFAESIHSLRFTLRQAAAERQISVILMTSALPSEGKSTVAINLARACAMYGDRVLLIDADLRRPSVAARLELVPSPGLIGVVRGNCEFQGAILRDQATNLHVMAGASAASGAEALTLLASRDLGRLIADVRAIYDLVLIDASPLLPVADSRFLVNQADAVALVVASERTGRSAVRAALQETPGLEPKILGAVMNRVVDDFAHNYLEYKSFNKVA
ncbi:MULTISPECIES: AAA family ATPase [Rhodomicrobium]|uniref:GumC family protein n=1 Tax=Rhodomicrobium TaxID=1068 RepID=UPI000B4AF8E4|nr:MULTISPECIES: AAA family ATPase [Rhodomicrobium]